MLYFTYCKPPKLQSLCVTKFQWKNDWWHFISLLHIHGWEFCPDFVVNNHFIERSFYDLQFQLFPCYYRIKAEAQCQLNGWIDSIQCLASEWWIGLENICRWTVLHKNISPHLCLSASIFCWIEKQIGWSTFSSIFIFDWIEILRNKM